TAIPAIPHIRSSSNKTSSTLTGETHRIADLGKKSQQSSSEAGDGIRSLNRVPYFVHHGPRRHPMASWAKKRVIVTGGSGFLGGHLVRQLRQEGAVVRAPSSKDCDLLRFDH